jgi:hypothetical protein
VAKDRARPFSRKHKKYWIPVTGGMIVIGAINVGLGYCTYDPPAPPPTRIQVTPDEDPAAKMARDAAKRALDKRAHDQATGSAGSAGSPPPPAPTP